MTQPAIVDRLWSLIRQLQGALGGNRIIRGTISTTSPSIVAGTGFSISKNGTADVSVTFDEPFSSRPAIDVDAVMTAGTVRFATKSSPSATGFRVIMRDGALSGVEGEFDFIAIGPV